MSARTLGDRIKAVAWQTPNHDVEEFAAAGAREALLIAKEREQFRFGHDTVLVADLDYLIAELTDGNQAATQSSGVNRGSASAKTTDVQLASPLGSGFSPRVTEMMKHAICRHGIGNGHGDQGLGRYCEECGLWWGHGSNPRQVVIDQLITAIRSECAHARETLKPQLACYVCGQAATCIGNYEADDHYQPACDTHCGHGNEDGWCRPIPEAIAEMSKWIYEFNTKENTSEQARETLHACPICLVWTGFPLEVIQHIASRHTGRLRDAFEAGAKWVAQAGDPAREKVSIDRGFADFQASFPQHSETRETLEEKINALQKEADLDGRAVAP